MATNQPGPSPLIPMRRLSSGGALWGMGPTAEDLLELGVVDEVIPEPLGGAHTNAEVTARVTADWSGGELELLGEAQALRGDAIARNLRPHPTQSYVPAGGF